MAGSFTIEISELKLYGHHGLHDEESIAGNLFQLDISMQCAAPDGLVKHIKETIDYSEVSEIVKSIFAHRELLLETVAMKIADAIAIRFPLVQVVQISITKFQPPIAGFNGSVRVTYAR